MKNDREFLVPGRKTRFYCGCLLYLSNHRPY
jgi:hypothetical protein